MFVFSIIFIFVVFCLVPHWKCVQSWSQVKPI